MKELKEKDCITWHGKTWRIVDVDSVNYRVQNVSFTNEIAWIPKDDIGIKVINGCEVWVNI